MRSHLARAPRRCVVLDDRERDELRRIQRRLRDEDPDFTESFHSDARHLPRRAPDLSRRTYTVLLVISSTSCLIMMAAGSPFIALLFAGLAAWVWYARAHPYEDDQ
ncbi:DUF3040 domain-containing protein [Nonomuraea sp. C10]|nr:DUF3040 domain-containing protein [Nonomuraea sp. C10]